MEGNDKKNVEKNYLSPMTKIIADIKDKGYTKEFIVREGKLKAMGSGETYEPDSLRLTDEYRFEGTSDPEYMSILYTIESDNGDKGYITNAYGTYSDEEVNEFIKKIDRIEKKPGSTNKKI